MLGRVAYLEDVEYYIGGAGNDDLGWVRDDRNVLVGNGGSDRLTGGALADELYGDEGPGLPEGETNRNDDPWVGNSGYDDLLDGQGGADRLTVGAGADVFQFSMGEADGDVVTDFNRAEGDYLFFEGWGPGATFTQVGATNQWRLSNADGTVFETVTFANGADIQPTDWLFY